MAFKIKDIEDFAANVFGADSFIEYFPEIESTGVDLIKEDGVYYITKNGEIVSDSAFFSEHEMQFLEEVKE